MRRRVTAISAAPGSGFRSPDRSELERLGAMLNEMPDRLEATRERDFVADAGHELRTPLALLRTELELALHHADSVAELKEAVRRSSLEADRLSQLAEDLGLIARSDRGGVPLRVESLDTRDLLPTVPSRVDWRVEAEDKSVRADLGDPACVHSDRLRLEQALANIVDNALRHTRAPRTRPSPGRLRMISASG